MKLRNVYVFVKEVNKMSELAFSQKLRYERLRHSWSQEYLAGQVGVEPKTVARWERGLVYPSTFSLLQLCEIFNKSIEGWGLIASNASSTFQSEIVTSIPEAFRSKKGTSNDFHSKLKYERKKRGLSQEDLAAKIGCDQKTVARWERGASFPRSDSLRNLCTLFNKSVEEWGLLEAFVPDAKGANGFLAATLDYREDIEEAPNTIGFCGRMLECEQLTHWIGEERARLVAILGGGGIGKTTLAARVVQLIRQDFSCVFWRSLRNAPPLREILKQCLHFLSFGAPIDLPEGLNEQLALLTLFLQQQRCLLVLDNVETILQPEEKVGSYRSGYENYADLFQCLGQGGHRSCLMLTSRERPNDLVWLANQDTGTHLLHLEGMLVTDCRELLKGSKPTGTEEQWHALIARYSGNPLALKLIVSSIEILFDGQIGTFLQEQEFVFGTVTELLRTQFQRLSAQEQEILYWLAIEREAIPLDQIRANLARTPIKGTLLEALQSLITRSLIEMPSSQRFSLQPVILEYVITELQQHLFEELMAVHNAVPNGPRIPSSWQRFAFIKARSSDYLRYTQIRFLLAPLTEQLVSTLGQNKLEQYLKSLLEDQRQVESQGSYLAGNILNLLLNLHADLRGFDCSGLSIRQAYLQNAQLPQTNFTSAYFRDTVFTNTFGAILSVAFNQGGDLLAVGTATGQIWLYRVTDTLPIAIYNGHRDGVWALSFSPDGQFLASGSDDQTALIWQISTGQISFSIKYHTNRVRAVAFNHDGKLLAIGSYDQKISLWNTNNNQFIRELSGHNDGVWSLAFHPHNNILASGSADRTICLWDLTSDDAPPYIFSDHTDSIRALAFDPTGRLLASACDDKTVRLWDIHIRSCVATLRDHANRVWSVAFSPDGQIVASSSEDRTIRLWQVANMICFKVLQEHTNGVRAVTFAHSGLLASGGDDQTLRLWDSNLGRSLQTFQGYTNRIWDLALLPTLGELASASEDQFIRLWNIETGLCFRSLSTAGQGMRAIAIHPHSMLLASTGADQTIHLWDLKTGQQTGQLKAHDNWIRSIMFSPDGKFLASSGEDNMLALWDISSVKLIYSIKEHYSPVKALAFRPDSQWIASGSDDGDIGVWTTSSGARLHLLKGGHTHSIRALAFHPIRPLLVSASEDHLIRIWDLLTGSLRKTFTGHTDRVISISFDPTGTHLVSCSDDLSIRIWHFDQDDVFTVENAHDSRIRKVVYTPDGRFFASCSDDGSIKIWDAETYGCVKVISSERPYEGMKIAGVTGLSEAQITTLLVLGAEM